MRAAGHDRHIGAAPCQVGSQVSAHGTRAEHADSHQRERPPPRPSPTRREKKRGAAHVSSSSAARDRASTPRPMQRSSG